MEQMLNGLIQSRNTREKKKDLQYQLQTIKTMAIGTYISIITLNVNGLNTPTKRHRLAEQIQKQDPYTCCLQVTHFIPEDRYRLGVRGWKNILNANGEQKKAGVASSYQTKQTLK